LDKVELKWKNSREFWPFLSISSHFWPKSSQISRSFRKKNNPLHDGIAVAQVRTGNCEVPL